jgi:uncharacterized protein (DUF1015 family)
MAQVIPFRGIRYDPARVGDLDRVVSPPYDVVGPELQEELYRRSPYNIVRIDYGKERAEDDAVHNRYARGAALLREWLRNGVLRQDSEPSLYYQEEDYEGEFGERQTRTGFFVAVRIEDPGSGLYRPHEKTMAGPKADRLRLTQACRANLSPVFSLYDDPELQALHHLEGVASSQPPLLAVTADDGVVTRLWRVVEQSRIRPVAAALEGKSFFIADGHHRYETALNYRNLMRETHPRASGREPWNYVLMYLSNLHAPGLTVLPTHRAVYGLEGFELGSFLPRLGEYFDVEEVAGGPEGLLARMRAHRGQRPAFGLAAKGQEGPWLAVLRDAAPVQRLMAARVPEVLRALDVTLLHALVLEQILGIDEKAQEEQRNLRYVKGSRELFRIVREEDVQLGFLLNPTRVEQVQEVAEQGQRMPQKSTFFYPKLVTGLVIHPLFEVEALLSE